MRSPKAKQISPKKTVEKSFVPTMSPQVQKIMSIKQRYRKNIETPIQNIQAIEHSNTPQRCLTHNTMLTLYCQIDRKALCANCMYQQDTHRKHRVIPIGRAMNLVKEDINSYQIKLEGILKQCTALSHRLQETIVKNQRYYPAVVNELKDFYKNMIYMLKQKERQQISQIEQQHEKIKSEIIFLDHQIKGISSFIASKIKPIKKAQTEDLLLARRGVLEVLTKVNKTINDELSNVFQIEQTPNLIDFTLFNDISQVVKNRLIVVLPGISVNPRRGGFNSSNLNFANSNRNTSPVFKARQVKSNTKEILRPKSVSNKKERKEVKFVFD